MEFKYFSRWLSLSIVVCIIGASLAALGTIKLLAHAANMTRMTLSGQVAPAIAHSLLVGPANTQQQLHLTIALQPRNSAQLNTLLQTIYTPHSAYYHHYLSPAQYRAAFGATPAQLQAVVQFLQANGLQITNVAPNDLLIDATGSVAQAQAAFQVQINTYRQGNMLFYANATPPTLPPTLGSIVAAIDGLDNSITYYPLLSRLPHTKHKPVDSSTPNGYGPTDLLGAYDIARLQQTGTLGDNQTIALFELDGYQASDIAHYLQYYSPNVSTPRLNNILVDGFNGSAGMSAVEDELDIELLSAIAPHATLLVYEGPNSTQGINDTYSRIVNDNHAKIVTISWGLCEAANGNAELQTLDNIFKQGAAEGISFFAASGDSGAYDCRDNNLWVDSPASDPYVTAVGGTSLQVNNGVYGGESAWSNPQDAVHGPKGAGSGGGLSSYFKRPSWQSGNGVLNQYSNGNREVPDISAFASFSPGYAVYCTVTNAGCPPTGWVTIGGTSGGAPLWAGSFALINQYLVTQGVPSLGLASPALYALFRSTQIRPAFHDITTGNNLYYPATPGYDLATGMGSPDVFNMALDLAPNSANAPAPIPPAPPAAPVAPTAPTAPVSSGTQLAQDTFQRADQSTWGTATDGQTWGGDANNPNIFSIVNGQGQVANGNASYSAILGQPTDDSEVFVTGSLSRVGGSSTNIGAIVRWNDANDWYKAYFDGTNLVIQKRVNGSFTTLATTLFAASANTPYSIHFRVVGSALYANVWPASATEPVNWMLTATDTSLTFGSCGLRILIQGGAVATVTSFQAFGL